VRSEVVSLSQCQGNQGNQNVKSPEDITVPSQGYSTLLQMLMEILAVVEKFLMVNCEVSFKAWKKVFMKCMGILQCNVIKP
jgi:hypothetical protein